jgi:hypothetical protein
MRCPVCKKAVPEGSPRCVVCGHDLSAHGSGRRVFVLLAFLGIAVGCFLGWRGEFRDKSSPEIPHAPGILAVTSQTPGDPTDSLIRLANVALQADDCKNAVPLLQQITLARPDANNQFLLGRCLLETGKASEAKAWFEKAKGSGLQNADLEKWISKAGLLAQDDASMGQMESAHFHMWVEGSSQAWNGADTIFPALEKIYDRMCLTWNYYPAEKLQAVFYSSKGLQPREIPDWSGALFDGKIRLPYNVLASWPARQNILEHEVAHAFVHDLAKTNVAPWLDEGIAQNLDGTSLDWGALGAVGLAPLETLSQNFLAQADMAQARRLYMSSQALFQILLREGARNDMGQIRALLAGLSEGTPLPEAIQTRFGIKLEELYQKTVDEVGAAGRTP